MKKVGIVGASGYTGSELCTLLLQHPNCEISHIFSQTYTGKKLHDVYPQFKGHIDLEFEPFLVDQLPQLDILFLAVPHGTTHPYMEVLSKTSIKVIDLAADFRLNSVDSFNQVYKQNHQSTALVGTIPYGIPELYRERIKKSQICANPGCYSTSVILGLYPLAKTGALESVICDSKSGVSGAGKSLKLASLYSEANESLSAYQTGTHRHQYEIDEHIGAEVLFSPHLCPMTRGILSTMYCKTSLSLTEIKTLYEEFYEGEPFIIVESDISTPSTKHVVGSNNCFISFKQVGSIVIIFSAIDNLIKGAAGQAIQNMNSMLGFNETLGLPKVARYL